MIYTSDQVLNGIVQYIDNEILSKMPTAGKVVAGAVVSMALKNSSTVIEQLKNNQMLKAIGAITSDGLIDVDSIAECIKQSAEKYGDVIIQIPFMGNLTLKANDVDLLRRYIR